MQQLGARMAALNGKTALVTGASRGIGRATALALAKAGARVLLHYGRSAQDAESLVAAIRGIGTGLDQVFSLVGRTQKRFDESETIHERKFNEQRK